MANRITGMSGMDVEGMVYKMMQPYSMKVDNLVRQRTKLSWKQEKYRGYIKSMDDYASKYLNLAKPQTSLKTSSFFAQKVFSIKTDMGEDAKGVSVKNTFMSKNVEHTLKVNSLATKQKYTSKGSADGYSKTITGGEVNLEALQDGAETSIELNLDGKKIKATLEGMDDKLKDIDLTSQAGKDAAMDIVKNELQSQFDAFGSGSSTAKKVNVDTKDGKLLFQTESGRSLSVSGFSNGYTASTSMDLSKIDPEKVENETIKFDINGEEFSVGLMKDVVDEDGNVVQNDDGTTKRVKLTAKEIAEELNKQINEKEFNGVKDAEGKYPEKNFSVSASGNTIKFNATSQDQKFTVKETTEYAADAENKLTDGSEVELFGKTGSELGVSSGATTETASSQYVSELFSGDMSDFTITGNGKTKSFEDMEITADMTLSQMMTKINESDLGVKVSYSAVAGNFTMEAKESGESGAFTLNNEAMSAFGFDPANEKLSIEAKDAEIEIDGVLTTRNSNDFKVGDLDVTINKAAIDQGEITIKSASDTDKIFEGIKGFVEDYNKLLAGFNTDYTETRAKSGKYEYYEPLLDAERNELSENDIKLWEEKAKQGLMSKDASVGKTIDALRAAMSEPFELSDGRKISLQDIGISSTSWKDRGILTIDEDKLKKALEERPEDIADMFNTQSSEKYAGGNRQLRNKQNGIAYRMEDAIKDATSTSPRSVGNTTIYGYFYEMAGAENSSRVTENEMSRSIKALNEKIFDMEEYNIMKESQYYNMFSQMEKAMTKAQNQQSSMGFA